MYNMVKLNARNRALVEELVAANGGSPYFTRKQLLELHQKLRGRKCNPYFITKNVQAKLPAREKDVHPRGTLTVIRFLKFAEKYPLEEIQESRRLEDRPKKEDRGRREAKKVVIERQPVRRR